MANTPFQNIMTDHAAVVDETYFAANPSQLCILREEYDGEWHSPAGAAMVLVIRSRHPGIRLRIRVRVARTKTSWMSLPDSEAAREWVRKLVARDAVIDVDGSDKNTIPRHKMNDKAYIVKLFYAFPESLLQTDFLPEKPNFPKGYTPKSPDLH